LYPGTPVGMKVPDKKGPPRTLQQPGKTSSLTWWDW